MSGPSAEPGPHEPGPCQASDCEQAARPRRSPRRPHATRKAPSCSPPEELAGRAGPPADGNQPQPPAARQACNSPGSAHQAARPHARTRPPALCSSLTERPACRERAMRRRRHCPAGTRPPQAEHPGACNLASTRGRRVLACSPPRSSRARRLPAPGHVPAPGHAHRGHGAPRHTRHICAPCAVYA